MASQNFPDFDFKPKQNSSKASKGANLLSKMMQFCEKKWGKDSKLLLGLKKLEKSMQKDKNLDALTGLKQKKSQSENLNLILTLALVLILLFFWKNVLYDSDQQPKPKQINEEIPLLRQVDQLKNDIEEQKQIIEMEQQNMAFLEKIQEDRNGLQSNLNKVYAALPFSDEQAEEIISMLEHMGQENSIFIDSISIRKLPESQVNNDEFWGTVDVYEYAFSVESALPQILNFIEAIRSSLRIMDIMTLDIEEGKDGLYRGNFSLNAYHLISEQ